MYGGSFRNFQTTPNPFAAGSNEWYAFPTRFPIQQGYILNMHGIFRTELFFFFFAKTFSFLTLEHAREHGGVDYRKLHSVLSLRLVSFQILCSDFTCCSVYPL